MKKGEEKGTVPTYIENVADKANETGIKPGDLIRGSDMRTVTSPEQAITAAEGGVMTTANEHFLGKADIPSVPETQQKKFDRVIGGSINASFKNSKCYSPLI